MIRSKPNENGSSRAAAVVAAVASIFTLTLGVAQVAAAQDDAYRLYVANEFSADITVVDTATDEVIDTITISGRPGEVRPRGMAVSPDGSIVYVSISDFNPQLETPEDKIIAIDVARMNRDVAPDVAVILDDDTLVIMKGE